MKQMGQRVSMLVAGVLGAGVILPAAAADVPAVTSKFDVSLYGFVKLDTSYDSQRTSAGNLMFYVLPEGPDGRQDEFNMTARETRFGFNIRVPDVNEVKVSGRVEADFYSGVSENSPNPRLRLAYVDMAYNGWTVRAGQDWETFITVMPRNLNFATLADAGALGLRRPQVRVTQVTPIGEKMKLISKVAATRTIGQDLDLDGQDDGAAAAYPSFQGNLALEMLGAAGRTMVIGVSGHAGTETLSTYTVGAGTDAAVTVPEKDYDSWSVIGSLGLPLSKMLMLQGTIWAGENLDTYFGGIGQGVNKEMRTNIAAQGGWAQLVVDLSAKLNINFGYGLDQPESDDLNAGNRSKNEQFFSSVYYNLNSAVTLAGEYTHMTTSYKGGDDAENNRIQGSLIYRF